jgi:hypothetical protein
MFNDFEIEDQCMLRRAESGDLLPERFDSQEKLRDGLGGEGVDLSDRWFCMRCLSDVFAYSVILGFLTYERSGDGKNCPVYGRRLDVPIEQASIVNDYPLDSWTLVFRLRKK